MTLPHPAAARRRWMVAGNVLAALLSLWLFARVHAQGTTAPPPAAGPASLATYVAALEAAALTLAAPAAAPARAVDAARTQLAAFNTLQLPDGEIIVLQPLLADAAAPLSRADALARVQTMLTQLRAAENDQTASRLALLDQVWLQPEFTRGETLAERFGRWLAELLDRLFPTLQPDPTLQQATIGATELAGWLIAGAAALLLVWLLSLWLRRLLARFVADESLAAGDASDGDLPRTPAAARARADVLAQTGAYRDAVRHLYLAALLTLERRRLVTADRSLTNRELLALVPGDNAIRPYLRPVVDTFDAVWYGVQEPDAAAFAGYAEQIDGLQQAAGTGEAAST